MFTIIEILQYLLGIAYWVVLIHVIMSWLISFQVLNLGQRFVAQIWYGLNRLLAPVYDPVRRVMPNLGPLDLTPLVVFIGIVILKDIVLQNMKMGIL